MSGDLPSLADVCWTYVEIRGGGEWPWTLAEYVRHKLDLSDLGEPYLSAVKRARAAMTYDWSKAYQGGVFPWNVPPIDPPKPQPSPLTGEQIARGVRRYDPETPAHKALGRLFPKPKDGD